jgi:exonuclease VII large subunit
MASKRHPVVKTKKRSAAVAVPAAPAARPQATLPSTTESSVSDKKPGADAADRNVDQIRDILFGGQMRDYERRFVELNQRIEADFDALRQDQERRFGNLEKRLDEQFEKLSKALRQEVNDRTAAVDDLETRLVQGARTQRSELTGAIEALEQSQASAEERLRAALADLDAALKDQSGRLNQSLTRSRDELRADKVGREDLAALMTELALRLKGDFDLPGAR